MSVIPAPWRVSWVMFYLQATLVFVSDESASTNFFWFKKTKNCQRTVFEDRCSDGWLHVSKSTMMKRKLCLGASNTKRLLPPLPVLSSLASSCFRCFRVYLTLYPRTFCTMCSLAATERAYYAVLFSLNVDHANVLKEERKKTFFTMAFVSNIHSYGFAPDFGNLTNSSELKNGSRYILEGVV